MQIILSSLNFTKTLFFHFFGNRFCVKRFISCHDGKSYITLGIGIFLNDILPPYFFSVWVVAGQTCFSQSRSSLRVIKTVSVNSVWITTNGKPSYITLSNSFTAVGKLISTYRADASLHIYDNLSEYLLKNRRWVYEMFYFWYIH